MCVGFRVPNCSTDFPTYPWICSTAEAGSFPPWTARPPQLGCQAKAALRIRNPVTPPKNSGSVAGVAKLRPSRPRAQGRCYSTRPQKVPLVVDTLVQPARDTAHRVAESFADAHPGGAKCFLAEGRVAQSVERRSDKAKVPGSSPSMTTGPSFARPAWRNGSASVSGAGGCGFDPHRGWLFPPARGRCENSRSRQDSNLRGQSPVDFWSTP